MIAERLEDRRLLAVLFAHDAGDAVRAIAPSEAAYNSFGLDWIGGVEPFDDSEWAVTSGSPNGVGYDRGGVYDPLIGVDLEASMFGVSPTVFVRAEFDVADPAVVDRLTLDLRYDDGYIAWLNGIEIARANATTIYPAWSDTATAEHQASTSEFETLDLAGAIANLRAGTNVLAIRGLNDSAAGDDALIQFTLTGESRSGPPLAVDDTATAQENTAVTIDVLANDEPGSDPIDPTTVVLRTFPAHGTAVVNGDGTITYTPQTSYNGLDTFAYSVRDNTGTGQSGMQTLVASGAPVRAFVPFDDNLGTTWRGGDEPFDDSAWTAGTFGVGYDTNPAGVDFNPFLGTNVRPAMQNVNTTIYMRSAFAVASAANVVALTLRMRYDDGFAAFINGVPVASAFAPATLTYNSGTVGGGEGGGGNGDANAVNFQDFDITQSIGALQTGANVLAIHGLNQSLGSSDLLMQPELIATVAAGEHESNWATVTVDVEGVDFAPIARDDAYQVDEGQTLVATGASGGAATTETIIAERTNWLYRDSGQLPPNDAEGDTWKQRDYDDASWSSGRAQLGYGDGDESTVVSFGSDASNKHVTTWFRRHFTIDANQAARADQLSIEVLRDDGVAVYLNGVEVLRDNLPGTLGDGAVDASTRALTALSGADERDFLPPRVIDLTLPANRNLLRGGDNVVAVEIHQSDPNSSDISFDFRMSARLVASASVLANDTEPDGQTMTAVLETPPASGVLDLAADGTFTYTPNAGFSGVDTFSYRASDGLLVSDPATVTIAVNHVAPLVNDDEYATDEDTPLVVDAALGVLANDSDSQGHTLTAAVIDGPTNGELDFSADGSFTYTPDANYDGTDSFTYRTSDGQLSSVTATVEITVWAVDDAPVAADDHYEAEEGVSLVVDGQGGPPIVVPAGMFLWDVAQGGNGHVYERVVQSTTWSEAEAVARSNMLGDTAGHLATITSSAELAFLQTVFPSENAWIGGYQDTTAPDYSEPLGGWRWVTDEPFSFSNWKANEPNNAGNEDRLSSEGFGWNDINAGQTWPALWVEYPVSGVVSRQEVVISQGSVWRFWDNGQLPATDTQGNTWKQPGFDDAAWNSGRAELGYGDGDETTVVSFGPNASNKYITTWFRQHFSLVANAAAAAQSLNLELLADDGASVYVNGVEIARANLPGTVGDGAIDESTLASIGLEATFLPFSVDLSLPRYQNLLRDGDNVVAVEVHQTNSASSDISFDMRLFATVIEDAGLLANDTEPDGQTMTAVLETPPTSGVLDLAADGTFTYTPNAGFSGMDTFTYRASDGLLISDAATVTITVKHVAPLVNDDEYATDEDTPLVVDAVVGVLVNDTDSQGHALTATLVAGPAHGTLEFNADGSFAYTPDADYNGLDSFTYRASDGSGESTAATVELTVVAVNDAPGAVDDDYEVGGSGVLEIALAGRDDFGPATVADFDTNGTPYQLVQSLSAPGPHIVADSSSFLRLTEATNGQGNFVAFDRTAVGRYTTVTVDFGFRITPGAPASGDGMGFVLLNTAEFGIAGAPANFLAEEPDVLGSIGIGFDTYDNFIETDNHLSLHYDATRIGRFDFPEAQLNLDSGEFHHARLEFAFVPAGVRVTAVLTAAGGTVVTPIDDVLVPGVAAYESRLAVAGRTGQFTASHDIDNVVGTFRGPLDLGPAGVLANDSDIDGDALTAVVVRQPTLGVLDFNANGTFTYTPNSGFRGVDTFTYAASDGVLSSNVATVSVNVVNTPPVAANDAYSIDEDVVLDVAAALGLLANDSDLQVEILSVTLVAGPANGTLTLDADGGFRYVPDANFHGVDTFTYRASDGQLTSELATVTIDVASINDVPVAGDDDFTIDRGTSLVLSAPSVVAEMIAGTSFVEPATGAVNYVATGGEVGFAAAATPSATELGVLVTDEYIVRAASAPLFLSFDAVDISEFRGVSVRLNVRTFEDSAGSDFEPNDFFRAQLGLARAGGPVVLQTIVDISGDQLKAIDNGLTGVYTTFAVDIPDGFLTATLTIEASVESTTERIFFDDVAFVGFPAAASNLVLANDSDADGDGLTVRVVTPPMHGVIEEDLDGTLRYTPDPLFVGDDSFTYVANDGQADSNLATATIHVLLANLVPTAADDAYATNEDVPLVVPVGSGLLANDDDLDGDSLTVRIVAGPQHGTLAAMPDGSFSYTPPADYFGSDSFSYVASDGRDDSNVATVTITVTAVNDAPVAVDDAYAVAQGDTLDASAPKDVSVYADSVADFSGVQGQDGWYYGYYNRSTDGDGIYQSTDFMQFPDGAGGWSSTNFWDAANDRWKWFNGSPPWTEVLREQVHPNGTNSGQEHWAVRRWVSAVAGPTILEGHIAKRNTGGGDGVRGIIYVDGVGVYDRVIGATDSIGVDFQVNASLLVGSTVDFVLTPNGGDFADGTYFTAQIRSGSISSTTTELLARNAVWRYRDNITNGSVYPTDAEGDVWNVSDYADSAWQAGPAILGYDAIGAAPVRTTIGFGGNVSDKYRTALFRRTFDVVDADRVTTLTFDALIDDGAAVFINGREVLRHNLPGMLGDGTLRTDTLAPIPGDEDNYQTFVVDLAAFPGLLVEGTNTIAVEVHQVNANSSDLGFDLSMTATVLPDPVDAGVLGNDTDVEDDPLTAELLAGPQHGSLVFNADGTFLYTPAAGFFGNDSFTYRAFDGAAYSNAATARITVTRRLVAAADTYAIAEDELLAVSRSQGVLANDAEFLDARVSAELVSGPARGAVTLAANGAFHYRPAPDFFGTDTFTYRTTDGIIASEPATVTITVAAVNDAPRASRDSYSVGVGETLDATMASGSAIVADSFAEYSGVQGQDGWHYGYYNRTTDGDGVYQPTNFMPFPNAPGAWGSNNFYDARVSRWHWFNGDPPWTAISDDNMHPNGANNGAEHWAIRRWISETSGPVSIAGNLRLVNPSEQTGVIAFVIVDGEAIFTRTIPAGSGADVRFSAQVVVAVGSTVDFVVSPNGNEVSDTTQFVVTIREGFATTEELLPRGSRWKYRDDITNGAPYPIDGEGDFWTDGDYDDSGWPSGPAILGYGGIDAGTTATTIGFGGNSSNKHHTALFRRTFTVDRAANVESLVFDLLADDSAGIYINGVEVLRHNLPGTVGDGGLQTNTLASATGDESGYSVPGVDLAGFAGLLVDGINTIAVEVHQVLPSSSDLGFDLAITASYLPDPAAAGVLGNDGDAEGDAMTAALVAGPYRGTLDFRSDGTFTYTPDVGFEGVDQFTYRASDGVADSPLALVTINVGDANVAPLAADDRFLARGGSLSVPAAAGLLVNDFDGNGDALTTTVFAAPQRGTLSLSADGSFVYTPQINFIGVDSFTYRAADDAGTFGFATATIHVLAARDPIDAIPLAGDDVYAVDSTVGVSVAAPGVLSNDHDAELRPLYAVVSQSPWHGALSFASDGSFVYTPRAGFVGEDRFSYVAFDGNTFSAAATVTLTVAAPMPAIAPPGTPLGVPTSTGTLPIAGDVNGDGRVDRADLAAVVAAYGRSSGSASLLGAVDVNGDGRVSVADAVAVRNAMGAFGELYSSAAVVRRGDAEPALLGGDGSRHVSARPRREVGRLRLHTTAVDEVLAEEVLASVGGPSSVLRAGRVVRQGRIGR